MDTIHFQLLPIQIQQVFYILNSNVIVVYCKSYLSNPLIILAIYRLQQRFCPCLTACIIELSCSYAIAYRTLSLFISYLLNTKLSLAMGSPCRIIVSILFHDSTESKGLALSNRRLAILPTSTVP